MKSILIDSDILIEVSRGRDAAILARWQALTTSEDALFCSPVTIAEIWQGARPQESSVLDELFAVVVPVPIDAEIGRRAGEYLRQFARSHHVELGDALIAATASTHKLALWTRNRKHYPMEEISFY
ncbi:MAG TPA: type II toxin-antitoxin system VapC family toxin [Terriglobia bacterium]|nr:type II toxin-antitoxin system VapC family toxin [Terriglobia bacterium]